MEIIRINELTKMLSISKTSLWRLRKDKSFPVPHNLGPRMICWDRAAIEDWLRSSNLRGD